MTPPKFALVGIGNAMVDVLAQATDEYIQRQHELAGMERNAMNLIDQERAVFLYNDMTHAVEISGGSAGNTMAGFASFGGKGAYIGKTGTDQLGDVFRRDMNKLGVHFTTTPVDDGTQTGRCLVLITPDAQRTMNTFLGSGTLLSPDDIDPAIIEHAAVTYLEGYLFDPPLAQEAFYLSARMAHKAGRKVALSLSDPFCVDRHREDFLQLIDSHVDILFANEAEICSLYQTDDFEEAANAVGGQVEIAALTRSERGSILVKDKKCVPIEAEPTTLVDTTGAGDQYAAGFLYGYTQGLPLEECGRLASCAAAEVISHYGPRPEVAYNTFLKG